MTRRIAPAAALATAITLTLFWIMTVLIHVPEVILHPTSFPTVEIVEVERERLPPPPPPRVIERPEVAPAPSPPRTLEPGPAAPTFGGTDGDAGQTAPLDPLSGFGGPSADGDALPIVRVPPVYPPGALSRGVEGRVLVEFDVDARGVIDAAHVVVAEPPRVFDRAALEAIRQWRYSPKIERGRSVARRGLRIAIPFVLGGD